MGNTSSGDEAEGASRSKSAPPPISSTDNSAESLRKFKTVSTMTEGCWSRLFDDTYAAQLVAWGVGG